MRQTRSRTKAQSLPSDISELQVRAYKKFIKQNRSFSISQHLVWKNVCIVNGVKMQGPFAMVC